MKTNLKLIKYWRIKLKKNKKPQKIQSKVKENN